MGVAMEQLLVLFKSVSSTRAAPTASHFVGLRYAPASSMAGRGGSPAHPKQKPICPALLTTESVQVCSPRDTQTSDGPLGKAHAGGLGAQARIVRPH
jgi:hypothetical protein